MPEFRQVEDMGSAASRLSFGWDESGDSISSSSDRVGRPGMHVGVGRRMRGRLKSSGQKVKRRGVIMSPPSGEVLHMLRRLSESAQGYAAMAGYPMIVERAGGSESTYLHIRREGFWFGIRMSTHQPAYQCSLDYDQILFQNEDCDVASDNIFEHLQQQILDGGSVVADPSEVRRQIIIAEIQGADGVVRELNGVDWSFDAASMCWQCDCHAANEGSEITRVPSFLPRAGLSVGETAALRHRENKREKWAAAESGISPEQTTTGRVVFDGLRFR